MSRSDMDSRRTSRTAVRGLFAAAMTFVVLALAPVLIRPAFGQGVSIVRDAETEALLQDYLKPIFKAAGIPASQVQIFIVPSDDFNAFVADNQHMFVNAGAIIQSETPNELIGVLAHESGHVRHQDNSQLQQVVKETRSAALIASLFGIGAAVAGGLAGSKDAATLGQGFLTAVPSIAERSLLGYRRTQES